MSTTDPRVVDEVVATDPEQLREQALASLKKRRDLTAHVFSYIVINALLWAIWLVIGLSSGSWWPWPIFPTLGWGVGLLFHAWDVFLRRPITEADVRREMHRLGGAA